MSRPNPVFTDVVWNDVPKSWFDHSHKWEGTSDFAKLIPIYWDYFRPGDTIKGNVSVFGRSLPLKQPVYGDAYLHIDWFAVPLRLIWKNFTEFIQGVNNKGVPVSHAFPFVLGRGDGTNNEHGYVDNNNGSLVDFLGGLTCWSDYTNDPQHGDVPNYTSPSYTSAPFRYDALPIRAYCAIWNEYFRDEQLQDIVDYDDGDGRDLITSDKCAYILPVCAEKDRFSTARPNPQLGDVSAAPTSISALGPDGLSSVQAKIADGVAELVRTGYSTSSGGINISTTISDLRAAVALQHILETRNVGGFRYFEQVLSDFGVKMSDIRAQRPEFIGGDTLPFMINSVTQSSSDTADSYLGQMAGQGMFSKDTDNIYYEANEDVIVMAVMFVRPRAFYYQNIRTQFCTGVYQNSPDVTSWMDKFYNPKLQGLGDEAVLQYEVAVGSDDAVGADSEPDKIFGYVSQYSAWKCHNNEVHGEFKGSLRDWVYSRDCVLSDTYNLGADLTQLVQIHPWDYRHVYAYNSVEPAPGSKDDYNWSRNDHLLFDLSFGLEVRRSLEFYGTPGIGII